MGKSANAKFNRMDQGKCLNEGKLVVLLTALHGNLSGYIGGGLSRFIELLKRADSHGVKYIIIETKPAIKKVFKVDYAGSEISVSNLRFETFDGHHSLSSSLFDLISMWRAVFETIISGMSWVKKTNADLIMSPWERAPTVLCAYMISKLTSRPWTANMLLTPVFDTTDEKYAFSFSSLTIKKMYGYYRYVKKFSPSSASMFALYHWLSYRCLTDSVMIAINENVALDLTKFDSKIKVIKYFPGNAVDFERINKVKQKPEKQFSAIFAGHIEAGKGVFDLINVWKLVIKELPNERLVIIGKGPKKEVDLLYLAIKELGLLNNVFVPFDLHEGAPTQEDLWSYVKESELFLYPSMKDAWPGVVLEALACGVPVATYKTIAIEFAFKDCPSIFGVKPKDTQSLSQVVIDFLKSYDKGKSENFAQIARRFAEHFDYDSVMEAEKRAYIEVINRWKKLRR